MKRQYGDSMADNIMTLHELTAYLGIHSSTAYRMIKAKRIPAFKVGRDWRFNREHIDQWMAHGGSQHVNETLPAVQHPVD